MCILAFVCPEAYGPNAHVYGGILFFLEYICWTVAYKDIVLSVVVNVFWRPQSVSAKTCRTTFVDISPTCRLINLKITLYAIYNSLLTSRS